MEPADFSPLEYADPRPVAREAGTTSIERTLVAGSRCMTSERWHRVEQLYHAALGRDASQRAAFLTVACAGDEALRQDIESLLAHEQTAEGFLAAPAVEAAAKVVAKDAAPSLIGRQLGSCLVLSLLGAGGMGE